MTRYDDTLKNIHVVYDKENLNDTLGEVVSKAGLKQLRIAETEKYAHVTFFFSGGREEVFEGERRVLINSPKVATYDLKPEMSAFEVRDAVIEEINKGDLDFICLNFANGDMVGHTGVYQAIERVRTVDTWPVLVRQLATKAKKFEADHGNADNNKHRWFSNTAHSLNPVPCILVSDRYKSIKTEF